MTQHTTQHTSQHTLLVANRGEIAVRILRSARELGIRTVAVFSEGDRAAPHVRLADEAHLLGPTAPAESYLSIDRLMAVAAQTGTTLLHPGYGFLSESAELARRCDAEGIAFVGPTPAQLEVFGTKHTAREAAAAAGVPVFPGTGLLRDADDAVAQVEPIGYPVMLKATGGGGGIGMTICRTPEELRTAYDGIAGLAARSFGDAGLFAERYVERARHVEVQLFGDGERVVSLGDRDCSLQRRNQKVVEEAPAPDLPDAVRAQLHASARMLGESVGYRSAGTVEFVYDADRGEASFLEVNTRLQVEHPVTEEITGVDLVGWMLRLAMGETGLLAAYPDGSVPTTGHAIESRVYAEDPAADYRPSAGVITHVSFPDDVRVDGWIDAGAEVTTAYDPLLAKVVVAGGTRAEAIAAMSTALAAARVDGIEVNLGLLRAAVAGAEFAAATHTTRTLDGVGDPEPRITVERAGLMTTVQDVEGRLGLWQVGVPPSGAMDDRSLRLANLALGNEANAAGLECTVSGPALRFTHETAVVVAGAPADVTVDGAPVPMWEPVTVPAGSTLDIGETTSGLRTYVAVAGGLDVPDYLGSKATFTLGQFGGHGGRALRPGDVLRAGAVHEAAAGSRGRGAVPREQRPEIGTHWDLAVLEGPHASREFFTAEDVATLYGTRYEVHFNSARTGVRLVGPKPRWARTDGGEAGLHPSNIHDNAYAVGALDFTGDTPILLGPDGPSLGGFVCPVTVATPELWKLGQLRPGDTVAFRPVDAERIPSRRALALPSYVPATYDDGGVLLRRDGEPSVTYRRGGEDNILVEYGELVLDLALRARVHALHTAIEARGVPGVLDLTPGIRSLQVHVDPDVITQRALLGLLVEIEETLPATSELVVPSRSVRLPLSWDDPATREAIERYMAGVRDDAPWCPWNIEFIRRINGLEHVNDVYDTVFDASYLVLGLGDVYLGAPVATPLDPRHRLVTTKYNPARTWTAENSVGIGGAYLCIYGMEGPGGYQFVGRTTQVWDRWAGNRGEDPWLLRFFDRISWYPVSPEELLDLRADLAAGRTSLDVTDGTFSLAEHERFLAENAASIAEFREQQALAFGAERAAWEASGEFERAEAAADAAVPEPVDVVVPDGGQRLDAPFVANVWKVDVAVGDVVQPGQTVAVLEAMKMEAPVVAGSGGVVVEILAASGQQVAPGDALVVLGPADAVSVMDEASVEEEVA